MPLKDLLWACPLCHTVEGIDHDGRCRACHASFSRGRGAAIISRTPGAAAAEELGAVQWLERLPWPDIDGEGRTLPAGLEPPFRQAVEVRQAGAEQPLRRAGVFLGAVERFGPKQAGELVLDRERLVFAPQSGARDRAAGGRGGERGGGADGTGGAGGAGGWSWPLLELTAIQPASSAIQLKARGAEVVSVKFREGSVRLWEQRLKYCTREAWRAAGRGEIYEYQPRIRSR